jgi:signal transduction histidine kinase
MTSLRVKLITIVLMTFGITLAFSLTIFSLAVNARMDTLDDRSLSEQIGDIARHISWRDQRVNIEIPANLLSDYRAGAGHFIYIVSNERGEILSNYGSADLLRDTQIPPQPERKNLAIFSTIRHLAGEDLQFFAAEKWIEIAADKWINIQVAQGPLHDDVLADEILQEMVEGYGLIVLSFIVMLVVGIIIVVNQLTNSLRLLEINALNIRPGSTQQALELRGLPSELVPLVSQLNHALAELNNAFIQQKTFSDMAAHELRSPLAIVRGQAERLTQSSEKDHLMQDIGHMEQIVTRLLELARSESAVLSADQKLELGHTLSTLLADMGATYIRQGMKLTLMPLAEAVWVQADIAMLDVIIRNLLDNALAAGGPECEVTISYDAHGVMSVCDNGPGVPEDFLQKIFERFVRIDNSQTGGSTGLGLAIVQRLGQAQQARVSAHKAQQGGLEIRLAFLPAR